MSLKIILEIVLTCLVLEPLHTLAQIERGNVKIGDRCERDYNCIENAYCRVQRTCLCDNYYSPTLDRSMCIAISGMSCTDDHACRTMSNAQCRQGVCACKETYILDRRNASNCISRPSMIGDRCQTIDECQEAFDFAMCAEEKCQCITGYHFVNQTRKCIQTRYLYNHCTSDFECLLDKDNPDALQCTRNECVCKEGEPRCSKGSVYTAVGVTVAFLLLLHRLI